MLAIVSIISIASKLFILDDIPEKFKFGQEVGEMYLQLCLAFISSYIFYFVVVHLRREKDRENVNSFVNPYIRSAGAQWKSQLKAMCESLGVSEPIGIPDEAFVADIFAKIGSKGRSPLMKEYPSTYLSWFEYLWYYQSRVERFITIVLNKMPFLDSKLVQLLSELYECEHFTSMRFYVGNRFANTDLSFLAGNFHMYCVKSNAVETYANEFHQN